MENTKTVLEKINCAHCGDVCPPAPIMWADKAFCCEGCKGVYALLSDNDLCAYYQLENTPSGIKKKKNTQADAFAYLDEEKMQKALIHFQEDKQTHIRLHLPQIHCSSCLWLLENLRKLDAGVSSSSVNFSRKEISIIFDNSQTTLRKIAELLTEIGYEPHISLQDLQNHSQKENRQTRIYQLGVAGFCMGNVMMMSFPEYFSLGGYIEENLTHFFRYMNLLLSLPAFFFSAKEFFVGAWKGFKHHFLSIDAPIALALIITFTRSAYEVLSGTGSGYFDSLTGIIFFMLLGRVLQDKTHRAIAFDRDYQAYFPMAVRRIKEGKTQPIPLPDIQVNDILRLTDGELIPADSMLSKGKAYIDYSFITGESVPVEKEIGNLLYAGGRQMGGEIEVLVTKAVNQSYLTSMWNHREQKAATEYKKTWIDNLSQYFTIVVFVIALATASFWAITDASRILPAVTAILIVACPCALLLASSFTYGSVLSILSNAGLYLRNVQGLDKLAGATAWVFDKTGTLTETHQSEVQYVGEPLAEKTLSKMGFLARQSSHPLSQAVAHFLPQSHTVQWEMTNLMAQTGKGVSAKIEGIEMKLGAAEFVGAKQLTSDSFLYTSKVHVSIGGEYQGFFDIQNSYRSGLSKMF
ncbi:MAG: heavy metal translocating P-type ATPase [Bacteroidia bacterium]